MMTLEELDQEIQKYKDDLRSDEMVIASYKEHMENTTIKLEDLKEERKRMMAGQEVPINLTEQELMMLDSAHWNYRKNWSEEDAILLGQKIEKARQCLRKDF